MCCLTKVTDCCAATVHGVAALTESLCGQNGPRALRRRDGCEGRPRVAPRVVVIGALCFSLVPLLKALQVLSKKLKGDSC